MALTEEVEPLALRAEDGDDRHRSVDDAEPMRVRVLNST